MTQTYKVQVSMNQAHIVESGFVWKQGDFGFNIEIEVLDFDTTGATPQIIFRKSTGAVEATQISVAGNKFTYAIRGTELDTPGPCVCDLKLKDSTTKRVSTASFKYFVIPDTMDGLEQQASSYSDTIEQLLEDVVHLSDTPGLVKNDGSINTTIESNVAENKSVLNTTYNSASVNDLNGELDLSFTVGTAFVRATETFTPGYGSKYATTGIINCPADAYEVELTGNTYVVAASTIALFAFFDKDKTYIGYSNSRIATVPEGTMYIAITNYYEDPTDCGVTYKRYKALIDMIHNKEAVNSLLDTPQNISPTWTTGKRLDGSGSVITASGFSVSDFIPLLYGIYKLTLNITVLADYAPSICFYDEDKVFIPGSNIAQTGDISIPNNSVYFRLSNYSATIPDVNAWYRMTQLKRVALLEVDNANHNVIDGGLVSIPSAIHPTMTAGHWLNNGVDTSNGNQDLAVSGFIEIPYAVCKIICNIGVFDISTTIAFYTEGKTFISGVAAKQTSTIPSNAKYIRLCNYDLAPGAPSHENVTYTFYTLQRIFSMEEDIEELQTARKNNAPNWNGKKWCVIGDSITEENFRAPLHYWSYISAATQITVANKGISGTGYKQFHPFYERIEDSGFPTDCDIITMFGGVNDILGWGNTLTIGNYNDNTTDTICGCVNKAIDDLEAKYPIYLPLGIILPLPCKLDTTIEEFSDALYPNQYPLLTDCRMETFVTEMKKLCAYRGYPCLDLFHESGLMPWSNTAKEALFKPPTGYGAADGLHPNSAGHAKIYKKILVFIEKIIIDN